MSRLTGPVPAAAEILKPGTRIVGIEDPKKLDAASCEELAEEIKEKAAGWRVAFVEVEKIDSMGRSAGDAGGRSRGCGRRRNIC